MIDLIIKWVSLRARIYLSLGIPLISLLSVIFINYDVLNSVTEENDKNQINIERLIIESRIDGLVNQLQLAAQIFTDEGQPSTGKQVDDLYAKIRTDLYTSSTDEKEIAKILESLDSFYNGFEQLRDLREKRRDSLNFTLHALQERLYDEFNKAKLDKNSNIEQQELLREAQVDFLKSVIHAKRYFRTLKPEEVDISNNFSDDSIKKITELQKTASSESKLMLEQTKVLVETHNLEVKKTVQMTRGYLYLLNVILAAEANEIRYLLERKRDTIIINTQLSRDESEENINNLFKLSLIVILIASTIHLVFSYAITLSISRPIQKITEVFSNLSQGNTETKIPNYSHKDEIGDLSLAAKVFRQKNIENRVILNDYKQLSAELEDRIEQRTKELNELNQELNIAKDKAEEMVRLRSDFIANVSHEIRTPINAVLGMSYLLSKEELTDDQRAFVDKINTGTKKLLTIINDILDFSKIEAGKMTIEKTKLDLFQVVNDAVNLVQPQANQKHIELLINYNPHLFRFYTGDPTRLGQVILNLLNNAVKFTERGHVTLEISPLNIQRLKFAVKDTGIGMSEDELGNLFQAFRQADVSTTRRFGGTGLGLVISKQIVEAMGGDISVSSVQGEGTTFTFEIELKPLSNTKNRPFAGKVALLIDKNKLSRSSFNSTLQMLGMEVYPYEYFVKDHTGDIDVIFFAVEKTEQSILDKEIINLLLQYYPSIPLCIIYPNQSTRKNSSNLSHKLLKPVNPIFIIELLNQILYGIKTIPRELSAKDLKLEVSKRHYARFIVADDNAFNRQVIDGLLKHVHLYADEAENGEDLIQKVDNAAMRSEPYNLVIMDYHMPKLDGLEATKILSQKYPNLVIFILSGDQNPVIESEFLSAGAKVILTKPVDVNSFYQEIIFHLPATGAPKEDIAQLEHQNLPKLTHIDTKFGLHHSGDDLELYKRLLNSFHQKYNDGTTTLDSLNNEDSEKIKELYVHSLKGIAASIGAHKLSEFAEKYLMENLPQDLDELKTELIFVINELELSGFTVTKESTPHHVFEQDKFDLTIEDLKNALKRRRPKEIQPIMDYIKDIKLPDDEQRIMDSVSLAVEQYDFAKANKLLDGLN